MLVLRPYQNDTLQAIYAWFTDNQTGNPCVEMPTGSGKSVLIAALVKQSLELWPDTSILMLTHVKELIEQNHAKLIKLWPDAPVGIYSASIGQKVLNNKITFAGIQSVCKRASELNKIDLIIIDECHLISHKDEGNYRKLIKALISSNPHLRVIGFTATPYRLGHGYIHQGENALFSDIITPISIEELVQDNYLARLHSKHTSQHIDTSDVHIRGGEFIPSELSDAAIKANDGIVAETLVRAKHCKSILVFASGVEHAETLATRFTEYGERALCVTGNHSMQEREDILEQFTSGKLRILTNANILTTGFDYPDIDCIVLARPTMSAGLYVQMAGRGLRVKSHTDHCLVLDFAGCVMKHGAITMVRPPAKKGTKVGDAPVKICPGSMDDGAVCMEILHLSVMKCHVCGYEYTKRAKPKAVLYDDDIMGASHKSSMSIGSWRWGEHTSAQSGKRMLKVRYYGRSFTAPVIVEYFPVTHTGFAGDKARGTVAQIANLARAEKFSLDSEDDLANAATMLNNAHHPMTIKYRRDGKFYQVTERTWHDINN